MKIVDPLNFKELLLNHYKHYLDYHGSFDHFVPSDAARQDAALTIAMSSRIYYKIHCLASTSCRTTRTEVHDVLGVKGTIGLDELLNQGVLIESDGCISDPFYDLHEPNEDNIRRMIKYNLDEFYPDDSHAIIFNIVEGLNGEGLRQTRALQRQFLLDLQNIVKNPECLGNERLFVSAVMGKLIPKKADVGHEPSTKHMDISSEEELAAIAHDMRAPMKYVLSFLDSHTSESMSTTQLKQARNAAMRVDLMIDSLRKLNGYEITHRQMDTFSLNSVIEFAEMLADDFKKKFRYSGPKEFSGYMDRDKIDRLIQNLLMNAFEAADTLVTLEYLRENDFIKILVSDDGPGVPQEHVDRIFERGFTVGKTHGSGLGLATVNAIVQEHEGEVRYERKCGKTFFKVLLKNVFTDAVFEEVLDPVADRGEPIEGMDDSERPILVISLSDQVTHNDLLMILKKELQSYFVTDDLDQLSHARVVCTDDVALASQAVEAGVRRVWAVPCSITSHSDFAPALLRLAQNEYPAEHFTKSGKETI